MDLANIIVVMVISLSLMFVGGISAGFPGLREANEDSGTLSR